jgi:hypothetical protein
MAQKKMISFLDTCRNNPYFSNISSLFIPLAMEVMEFL